MKPKSKPTSREDLRKDIDKIFQQAISHAMGGAGFTRGGAVEFVLQIIDREVNNNVV